MCGAYSARRLAFVVLCACASLGAGGGFATRTPFGLASHRPVRGWAGLSRFPVGAGVGFAVSRWGWGWVLGWGGLPVLWVGWRSLGGAGGVVGTWRGAVV
ncbi:hypothetical protein GCM10029976_077180 [Kribbella albertanoniae]